MFRRCLEELGEPAAEAAGGSTVRTLKNVAFMRALVYVQLGKVYESTLKRKSAMKQYRLALEAFPKCIEAHTNLGGLLRFGASTRKELKRFEMHMAAAVDYAEELYREDAPWKVNAFATQEKECANIAKSNLALFLCQEGRDDEAGDVLDELEFDFRLGREVLHYSPEPSVGGLPAVPGVAAALDGALPPDMLAFMQAAFGPGSCFWGEHRYDEDPGYFSYLHGMPDVAKAKRTGLEQVLRHICEVARGQGFPEVARATKVEWWAHCRPHTSGHQLHFDSEFVGHPDHGGEEGPAGEPWSKGRVRHPLLSAVLYLTAGVGGPTLVADQVLGGPLARRGWLCYPRANRLLMFKPDRLHGVVPGRGPAEAADARRVTLMVSFWDRKVAGLGAGGRGGEGAAAAAAAARPGGLPGPCMRFPGKASPLEWPRLLPRRRFPQREGHAPVPAALFPVAKVWEDIYPEAEEDEHGAGGLGGEEIPPYDACFQF